MATFSAMELHSGMNAEATHFMPEPSDFKIGPEQYLRESVVPRRLCGNLGRTLGRR